MLAFFLKKRFYVFIKKHPKTSKNKAKNEARVVPTNLSHGAKLAQNAPKPCILTTSPPEMTKTPAWCGATCPQVQKMHILGPFPSDFLDLHPGNPPQNFPSAAFGSQNLHGVSFVFFKKTSFFLKNVF